VHSLIEVKILNRHVTKDYTNQDDIIEIIHKDLNRLHVKYEADISKLENNNRRLEEQVVALTNQLKQSNHHLSEMKKMTKRGDKDLLIKVAEEVLVDINDATIISSYLLKYQEICYDKWPEKTLEFIELYVQKKEYDIVSRILVHINHCTAKNTLKEQHIKTFSRLSHSILIDWLDLDYAHYERCIVQLFKLLRVWGEHETAQCIKQLLVNQFEQIKTNVFLINSPKVITEMIRCYAAYALFDELKQIFKQCINEWEFLKDTTTDSDMVRMLMIALLLEEDMAFVDQLSIKIDQLGINKPEIEIYVLYYDIMNREIDYKSGIKKLKPIIKRVNLLTHSEMNRLIKYMNDKFTVLKNIEKQQVRKKKPLVQADYQKTQHIHGVKLNSIGILPDNLNQSSGANLIFENVRVRLALFNSMNNESVKNYAWIFALKVKNDNRYYLTKNQFRELSKQITVITST